MSESNESQDSTPVVPLPSRRDEEIALDMMKFIATTTGYGRGANTATGFQGASAARVEDSVEQLIELYRKCLGAVRSSAN